MTKCCSKSNWFHILFSSILIFIQVNSIAQCDPMGDADLRFVLVTSPDDTLRVIVENKQFNSTSFQSELMSLGRSFAKNLGVSSENDRNEKSGSELKLFLSDLIFLEEGKSRLDFEITVASMENPAIREQIVFAVYFSPEHRKKSLVEKIRNSHKIVFEYSILE